MLQVVDIRRQANEALQQAQAEITEAEQAAANAHQQVLGEPMLFPLSMHHAFSNCRDRVTIMQNMQCNACIYTNAIKCPDTKNATLTTVQEQANTPTLRKSEMTYSLSACGSMYMHL